MNYLFEFKELAKGKYKQEFTIGDNFLEQLNFSDIKKGEIFISAEIDITSNAIFFEFDIRGSLEVMCDVCLDYFNFEVKEHTNLSVIFGDNTDNTLNQDNKIVLSKSNNSIDLTEHFRDYILLSLPIKKVHPLDEEGNRTCNTEFLIKLEEFSTKKEQNNDPRWDKLKDILK